MRPNRSGFSFMEVLISVVVLSIGILATMSAMTYTLGSIDHDGLVPRATIYAQRILETIRVRNLAFTVAYPGTPPLASGVNSAAPTNLDAFPFADIFAGEDVGRFQRTVTMERLIGGPPYQQNMMKVTVEVSWTEARGVDEVSKGGRLVGGKTLSRRRVRIQSLLRS